MEEEMSVDVGVERVTAFLTIYENLKTNFPELSNLNLLELSGFVYSGGENQFMLREDVDDIPDEGDDCEQGGPVEQSKNVLINTDKMFG